MVQCPIRPRLRRLPLPASHRPGSVPTNNIRDPTTRMPVAIPAAMTATYPFFGGGGGDGGTGGNDLRVSDPSTAILPVASSPKASGCMASCSSYGPELLVTTLGLEPQAEAILLSPSSVCSDSPVRMRWQRPCLSMLGESRWPLPPAQFSRPVLVVRRVTKFATVRRTTAPSGMSKRASIACYLYFSRATSPRGLLSWLSERCWRELIPQRRSRRETIPRSLTPPSV